MNKHERTTRLNPLEKPRPLSNDLQFAIEISKKTIGWSKDADNPGNKKGCTTGILFASMFVYSDLTPRALVKCGINPSEVLTRLEDHYHIDKMSAPNYTGGLSKGAFDALQKASVIAKDQQAKQVNSIHVLLGMISGDNVVETALHDLGLDHEKITTLYALAQKAVTSSKSS